MKNLFNALTAITFVIAGFVFLSGAVITILGIYDFFHAFAHLTNPEPHKLVALIAVGLLRAVDLFLIALVLFVFSLGVMMLFSKSPIEELPFYLPEWLKIKSFIQLKVILWEAVLTTLVVSFFANLAHRTLSGMEASYDLLIIPGIILIIALSLFFLKKGEH